MLVDADACPVKDEIYKVAKRHRAGVTVVSNAWLRIPADPALERVMVSDRVDAAGARLTEQRLRDAEAAGYGKLYCPVMYKLLDS